VNESVGRGGPRKRRSRDCRASGHEPRAGWRADPSACGSQSCDTSDRAAAGSSRRTVWTELARKRRQRLREKPGGGQAHEGRGTAGAFTGVGRHRIHRGESKPCIRGVVRWRGSNRRRAASTGQRAAGGRKVVRLCGGGEPPEGKPWTWQRDETSLQRPVAEQTVESVRNAADGPSRSERGSSGPAVDDAG
jgi:hypothetical protein